MARLLLLDDQEDNLAWMTAALETRGHEVRGFSTGRAALTSLAEWTPDLIVADILMPEMDGLTFARLAHRHKGVPVMFVSIAKKQAEAILAGAVGYLQKPATAAELREAVDRVLGRASMENTLLVVDDDADVRALCRSFLEPRFQVVEAADGKEALDLLARVPVDLAIVDIHMPGMNGVELIRAARSNPKLERLPIIVQSSDPVALAAPVWRDLHVAQVVDKGRFLEWFFHRVEAHVAGSPP